MMYLELAGSEFTELAQWHTGEPKPFEDYPKPVKCISIQADGDELNLVLNTFLNLPSNLTKPVQTWTGDFAQFIYDNL